MSDTLGSLGGVGPVPARRRRSILLAVFVLAASLATVAAAFGFQAAGYAPCELCLKERLPYYVGMGVAAATLIAACFGAGATARFGFAVLTCLFLFSAGFGAYHAGVEWKLWQGPMDCTGSLTRAPTTADFLNQLQTVHVVRCDAVSIRVLGLSLAGWNAVVSSIIALAAGFGLAPPDGETMTI